MLPCFNCLTESYVYWTLHHLDSRIKIDQLDVTCFIMSRKLVHPSSGACDLFVELFHGLYWSGSMRVGVTLWFAGVVWYPDTTSLLLLMK